MFGHPDEYWGKAGNSDLASFDEIMADYFSLASQGQSEAIAKIECIYGKELMDVIRNTYKQIADKMDSMMAENYE